VRASKTSIHTVKNIYTIVYRILAILMLFTPLSAYSTDISFNLDSNIDVTLLDASTGETLIGVNIYTGDFGFSTTTDIDGKATIIGLGFRDEVFFSYVGFTTRKLPIYEIRRLGGKIKLFTDTTADTIVVVGRRDDPVKEIPYAVDRITQAEITFSNAQTSADALAAQGGVFIQKSQMGGGSPVIRGFEANRVLLVVDGVRMNNAIYRNGHLQNSITVDNSMLEQVEVVFGPGSLMYGSEALGGVVHYRTKDPQLIFGDTKEDHIIESNYSFRFSSANLEKRGHFDVAYGKRKWGFVTSLTTVDYDALRAGGNRPVGHEDFGLRTHYPRRALEDDGTASDNIIVNLDPDVQIGMGGNTELYRVNSTGYSQIDFLQKIKFQPNDYVNLTLNYQYSSSTNIPRYDALLDTIDTRRDLKWSEWYYGPQQRSLGSAKLKIMKSNPLFDKLTLIGAYQNLHEERVKRKYSRIFRTVNKEEVDVYTATLDLDKYLDEKEQNQLSYGVDFGNNEVQSVAREVNVRSTDILLGEATRYPSAGSSMMNLGTYLNYRWRSQDSTLVLNGGLRYSMIMLDAQYLESDNIQWPDYYYDGISNDNKALTWAGGLIWNTKSDFQLRLLAAKAFRSPNIDDWAKVRVKNNKVRVPNIALKPETAINYELTLAQDFGNYNKINRKGVSFKLSATAFYSQLMDAIVTVDSSTLVDTENLEVDGDLYNIQTNINASDAKIMGLSLNAALNVNNTWKLNAGLNYTKGTTVFSNEVVQDTIVPFAHIAPMYGQTSLSWQKEKFRMDFTVKYNGAKLLEDYAVSDVDADGSIDREGTADNIEQSYTVINNGKREHIGTLAWTTLNFYSSFKLGEKLSLNLAVENILDLHYRPFASGLSAPGRNFVIALNGKF